MNDDTNLWPDTNPPPDDGSGAVGPVGGADGSSGGAAGPVGPLGAAMADLVAHPPASDLTAWSVMSQVRTRRSVRRQAAGGLAAGVAAIVTLVLIGTAVIGSSSSDSATSAASTSSSASLSASSSAAAAVGSVPSSASTSRSPTSGSSGPTSASAAPSAPGTSAQPGVNLPAPGTVASENGSDGGGGAGPTDSGSVEACRPLPFTEAQLRTITDRLPGLTPQSTCAVDDAELAVQDYTLDAAADVTLRAEFRAGTYNPCLEVEGSVCADVGNSPGVIFTERARGSALATLVWISGREGSVVLTLTVPADTAAPLSVNQLAAAVADLAASR